MIINYIFIKIYIAISQHTRHFTPHFSADLGTIQFQFLFLKWDKYVASFDEAQTYRQTVSAKNNLITPILIYPGIIPIRLAQPKMAAFQLPFHNYSVRYL